jgi:hypothetical protein
MLEPEAVTAIVRLGQSGWGAKRIARTLGIARNTVRRYLNAGGPVAYRQPRRASVLGGHQAWLRERFLQHRGNCDVVRQQLSKELGIDTSLRTVERACRGFRQELEASRRATIRFETAPGEQMQIDFGQTRVLIGGESVRVFLFVATLGYSRRGFVCAFRHERQSAWFAGIEAAFAHFGGRAQTLLIDNPKALVDQHNPQTPPSEQPLRGVLPALGYPGQGVRAVPRPHQGQDRERRGLREEERHRRPCLRELGRDGGAPGALAARGGRCAHPRHDGRHAR